MQTPNERRIIDLLNKRIGRKASAPEIAKHVGFPTKKGVNPLLYDMQKRGVIRKVQESPPIWQLIVTATNSGPGGYLTKSSRYSSGSKPLSPADLLRNKGHNVSGGQYTQFAHPGLQAKRPRLEQPTVESTAGIPSLLNIEPHQIAQNFTTTTTNQGSRKSKKNDSVSSILRSLNANRKGSGAPNTQFSAGAGADFKPPPSPMEMLHGSSAGIEIPPNKEFSNTIPSLFATQSSYAHNMSQQSGAAGNSGIASWLSTPTRPSWMKLGGATAATSSKGLASSCPTEPNVAPLMPTSTQMRPNGAQAASQKVSPTPRQPVKKERITSVNSLLKQLNANRKGAYSPQPLAPTTTASGEKFVPPPSPAELLSQHPVGGGRQLNPPSVGGAMGRISPNIMLQPLPPTAGRGRGALLAGLQSNHGSAGVGPPGGAAVGLGVGLTTAGIKSTDKTTKLAGRVPYKLYTCSNLTNSIRQKV